MHIKPDLADRLYTVLVQTIGAPDDYRRWSFIYAITEVQVKNYLLDSNLGPDARFRTEQSPSVVCADAAEVRQRMAHDASEMIREITAKEPAKIIRPIRIRATKTRRVKIPVVHVPSLKTAIEHLAV